jgi:hypothetical protein
MGSFAFAVQKTKQKKKNFSEKPKPEVPPTLARLKKEDPPFGLWRCPFELFFFHYPRDVPTFRWEVFVALCVCVRAEVLSPT